MCLFVAIMVDFDYMARLRIQNIGPISSVDISINRLNVIIGKQSTGKSTIAKILSFCLWLEKDIIAHQEKSYIDSSFLTKEFLDYHKIGAYLNEGTYVLYQGEYVDFEFYSVNRFDVSLKEGFAQSKIGKVAYIPAERNIVAITKISSLSMEKDYVRDYLFDWLSIHDKFNREHAVPVIDLGASFYYDTETGRDKIVLDNGKELGIEEVSSGMQSVIPLFVYLQYITKWIFENDEDTSFDKYSVLQKALLRSLQPNIDDDIVKQALTYPNLRESVNEVLRNLKFQRSQNNDKKDYSELTHLMERISRSHYVNVVVEEPELNLFPQTQVKLIYELLKIIDFDRDKLLLTTHSPYTLYAINNCMLGHLVKPNLDNSDIAELPCIESVINPKDVSVWQINDRGGLDDIKNSPAGIIGKHYFNEVMNDTLDEYHMMLNYLKL